MKEIIIRVRDDLDGSTAAETLEFRWRGIDYEIDLSAENVERADQAVAPLIAAARKAPPQITTQPRKRVTKGYHPSEPTNRAVKEQRRAIRQWAQGSGIPVSIRGHLKAEVIEAFRMAHPGVELFPEIYSANGTKGKGGSVEATLVRAQDAVNGEVPALELFAPKQLAASPQRESAPPQQAKPANPREKAGQTAKARAIPDKARRERIRAWARKNGHQVSSNGFISGPIVEAFERAHARNGERVH